MSEQEFILQNINADPLSLRLKFAGKDVGFNLENAITQIEARKKCSKKLPLFLSFENFRFPSIVAAEQASDQRVASFHAKLCKDSESILDITAGLGIDAMSIKLENPDVSITAIERDLNKATTLENNAAAIGIKSGFKVICADSISFIRQTDSHFDILFADPARRDNSNGRLYALKDCSPNLIELMADIFRVSKRFIFKVSPMLDISAVINEIPDATTVYAVSVKGELKELLITGEKGGKLEKISSIMIYDDDSLEEFEFSPELRNIPTPIVSSPETIKPGMFLYEPDASIMKFGCWGVLTSRFPGLLKLAPNTSLFISEWEYLCFPGRVTRIETVVTKKELKSLKGKQLNVTCRNYPLSTNELKKKIATKDGGDKFLYGVGCGVQNRPILLLSVRI